MRRFHVYETLLHYSTGQDVFTYVIFTGGITEAACEEHCGINTYRIIPIYMAKKDADEILHRLLQKASRGETLTDEDLVSLAMTPVMCSQYSYKSRIMNAVNILKKDTGEKSNQVMAVLYAFAEKFIHNQKDLRELKEVMLMTRLGQMLFDDGLKQGRAELKRINSLYEQLVKDNRMDDLKRAFADEDYQKKLIKEYNL